MDTVKSVILVLALVAISFVYFENTQLKERVGELETKVNPTVVVDIFELAKAKDGETDADVQARLSSLEVAINKLRDSGYLVLNANKVIASPESMALSKDILDNFATAQEQKAAGEVE